MSENWKYLATSSERVKLLRAGWIGSQIEELYIWKNQIDVTRFGKVTWH